MYLIFMTRRSLLLAGLAALPARSAGTRVRLGGPIFLRSEDPAELAREHQTKLVYLYVPRSTEMRAATVNPNAFWRDVFQDDFTMVGIPPAKLFSGLSDEQVLTLYWEYRHFNVNGQKFFTPIVTPALVQLYENKIKP